MLTQTPLDKTAGFYYSLPTTPPKITREQAIASVQNEGLAGKGKPAHVSYVLMSYSDPADQKSQAWALKEAGIQDKYPDGFKSIPAWIVTFCGLNMLPSLGGVNSGLPGTPTVDTQSIPTI